MLSEIKNKDDLLEFVKKAKANEKLLEQSLRVNKGLSINIKKLKNKMTWENHFIENVKKSLKNYSNENIECINIVEKNIDLYINKIEEENEILHPKYFIVSILYPTLSSMGSEGINIYKKLVQDIQHFLIQPYTPNEYYISEVVNDNYLDIKAFIKKHNFNH